MDDAKAFKLYQRADVDGVFQVESPGMRGVLKTLKPTVFADIVAVVALYRPGPMDSIPDFVARKHGRTRITYYDDRLRPILEETYGAIVYQEQVMRIAMEMSGFPAAKAEKLRKAMGKKMLDVMAPLKRDFIDGAVANGYDKRMVDGLWDDIEKFAQYAFNKSHAAAYALISYQTAYLKAHYPKEFMAAVLSSFSGKTENVVKYVAAAKRGGIAVLPPDVNSSGADFTAVPEGIRFGLAGVRNVGAGVVAAIMEERHASGPFTSLQDFCLRVDPKVAQQAHHRGAHQGRRVRFDRLHAQAPDAHDGRRHRPRHQAREGPRQRPDQPLRPRRRGRARVRARGPGARRRRVGEGDEARLREGDARHLRLRPPAARDRPRHRGGAHDLAR